MTQRAKGLYNVPHEAAKAEHKKIEYMYSVRCMIIIINIIIIIIMFTFMYTVLFCVYRNNLLRRCIRLGYI